MIHSIMHPIKGICRFINCRSSIDHAIPIVIFLWLTLGECYLDCLEKTAEDFSDVYNI